MCVAIASIPAHAPRFLISSHALNHLQDLKQLTGRKVVTEEMKRVVQLNVGRVVCPDNT